MKKKSYQSKTCLAFTTRELECILYCLVFCKEAIFEDTGEMPLMVNELIKHLKRTIKKLKDGRCLI